LDFVFGFPFGLASPVSVANTVLAMSLAFREASSRKGEGRGIMVWENHGDLSAEKAYVTLG